MGKLKYTSDTIAAISTSSGDSGIGIVRISGSDAIAIADRIFVSKDKKLPSGFKTYTIHYGWIVDSSQLIVHSSQNKENELPRNNIVDEVLLTVMRAPRSFTKEDIIEINCHGGPVAMRAVLDLALANGARLAEPGEFTKRAFLNGRIDLAQAEAVLDVISAKTEMALRVGARQLAGVLSVKIEDIRSRILEILALLEANIDFPEEEIGSIDFGRLCKAADDIRSRISGILDSANKGKIIRDGIKVVICGKANVGKSSLLNALLKEERSIVTHIAGTTRDTIEEMIDIRGIPVCIVDTAGMLKPRDVIEKKALKRSRKYIQSADLLLLLFDAGKKLDKHDRMLIKKLSKKECIAVINKIDLKARISKEEIKKYFDKVIEISVKKHKNINILEDTFTEWAFKGSYGAESVLISNLRHIEALKSANKLVAEARELMDNKLSAELIAQSLREAISQLDLILGKNFNQDLIDKIFNDFCIGK
ncbi:MAG: tRNA uridine-5-carboxymethylaminomethyl(34) synthesis GTPase MnmE [Candidatus Omnitrophota bacterium]|jgi:tRNA modification GTPase|nr:MAG: tRNA uridine-5-carboxymethylaminomethyl(34) synthesis GTPase MnmE [Candidatus Omnitrophota bacterium]